jgi:peptidoglycan/LPS O-acetylase OafA/YrhL
MATRDEIDALTGLRGIAAAWVLAYHTGLSPSGYLGVDLFFVLSGFIIAYNYADAGLAADGARYRQFLWRRLARIYPVYLVALLLTVAAVAALAPWGIALRKSAHFTVEGFWASVLMVQSWTLPVPRVWNVPGWSVSAEWAAYLSFPLIAARVRRVDSPHTALLAILVLYALLALAMNTLGLRATLSYGLVRIAAGFTAGVLLHRLWMLRGAPRDGDGARAVLWLVLLVGGATAFEMSVARFSAAAWLPVLAAAVVYGLASSRSRWLCGPFAQWLGRISFSLYMVHWPIVQLYKRFSTLLGDPLPSSLTTFAAIATSLSVASLMYRFVEEPARRGLLAWRLAPLRLAAR